MNFFLPIISGWQTISPQNMAYKEKMHQVRVNLVDVLEIDTDKRSKTLKSQCFGNPIVTY